MKRSELKADPEKTRAWQQRSAARAAEKARTRPRTPLKRSAALSDTGGRLSKGEKKKAPVKYRGPALKGIACERCGGRATSRHHWLPQQQIRVYVRGLARGESLTDAVARTVLGRLLKDVRNLTPLCNTCHARHELHHDPFTREDVPASAFAFADELGPEWGERLRRMYPARADEGDVSGPGREDPRRTTKET